LKILGDPKHALPPYDAVLLVTPERAHDEKMLKAFEPLIGAISLPTMQKANLMVDRTADKQTPEQAADWIAEQINQR